MQNARDFLEQLARLHIITPEQLAELRPQTPERDVKQIARELVERGQLTTHQANLLLQGRGDELLLGSYVLLDKLGEGGMGAVYRARNWKLGRMAAIKLIRKDRLSSTQAVERFYREIRAAAHLEHPNIVRAYDAGEVNGSHYFVMEYVDGIDLAKLVKEYGPLPPKLACEYIRQAALGLQHAHERGLVHRDIKPANMLLTRREGAGLIKLLDMGLARLDERSDGEHSATLTQIGMIMGTPDFMAPEQSVSSHTVDIRADLYSLGCSLYFLLSGSLPFPGGSLTEKLLKHQLEQPTPLEMLRPQIAPQVTEVVNKLLAKKPEDRFATPVELATILGALLSNAQLWKHDASVRKRASAALRSQPAINPFWAEIAAEAGLGTHSDARLRRPWVAVLSVAASLLVVVAVLAVTAEYWWPAPVAAPVKEAAKPVAGAVKTRTYVVPLRRTIEAHKDYIMTLSFAPDGQTLISGSHDRTAKAWDVASGALRWQVVGKLHEVSASAYSAKGNSLAVGTVWTQSASLLDPKTGKLLQTVRHPARTERVALTPDGRQLAVSGGNGEVLVHDIETKQQRLLPVGPCPWLEYSPDGRFLATFGKHELKLWEVDSQNDRAFASIRDESYQSKLAFTPDGKQIAVLAQHKQDRSIVFLEVPALTPVRTVKLPDTVGLGHFAISLELQTIAGCREEKKQTVWILWDTETGAERVHLTGPPGTANALQFSSANRKAAVGTRDGKILLWDVPQLPQ